MPSGDPLDFPEVTEELSVMETRDWGVLVLLLIITISNMSVEGIEPDRFNIKVLCTRLRVRSLTIVVLNRPGYGPAVDSELVYILCI